MKNFSSVIALFFFVVVEPVVAQEYVPVASENPSPAGQSLLIDKSVLSTRPVDGTLSVDVHAVAPKDSSGSILPECNPAPTLNDVEGALRVHQSLMSASAASKLGLPLGGVQLDGAGDQMLVVLEWSRGADCIATDGKTPLRYGQALRTVIAVSSLEAKGNLSLPALAASATINGRSSSVSIDVIGFKNPKFSEVVASIAGKELDVETYADFAAVQGKLIQLVDDPGTQHGVRRIGIVADSKERSLRASVATSFALNELREGRSCTKAQSNFPDPAAGMGIVIQSVYDTIAGTCDAESPASRYRQSAQRLLYGMKVKK